MRGCIVVDAIELSLGAHLGAAVVPKPRRPEPVFWVRQILIRLAFSRQVCPWTTSELGVLLRTKGPMGTTGAGHDERAAQPLWVLDSSQHSLRMPNERKPLVGQLIASSSNMAISSPCRGLSVATTSGSGMRLTLAPGTGKTFVTA